VTGDRPTWAWSTGTGRTATGQDGVGFRAEAALSPGEGGQFGGGRRQRAGLARGRVGPLVSSGPGVPCCVMHLIHLGLSVRDVEASRRFYETYFDFDPATARRGQGTITIRNADGLALALHGGEDSGPPPAFVLLGFQLFAPEEVEELRIRMQADEVDIIKQVDDPGYVSFTCTDPDGHRIEAYWEVSGALTGF
jgi:catechol 2,3-dioxygenase-like lactoylglutathione lyase family enzyme